MNIAILAPHLNNSGGNRILFSYANELTSLGHRVTVYTRSTRKIRRTIANFLQIGKPDWFVLRAQVIRVHEWKKESISMCDHVIAGGYHEALALATWNGERGCGWYMVQHDEGLYHGAREDVDRALQSPLHKIVVSSWLADVVRERAHQESYLLLNTFDRSQFFISKKPPHETVRILVLDHTYAWKGTEEALRMVRTLQKKCPQIRLVGMGRRRGDVARLYDEYHFDPSQNQIQHVYAGADIYLSTSWDEGFGLPSLEAMACGTAVVTYDNGGSRDFAHDGETAFVAPRRDENALSSKLELAVQDTELRATIAKQGNIFVLGMPTWQEQGKKLESILEQKNHV
jgi:glycosyltransferase involved in cell wall biosynthesis